jgi:hypothetical protein
MSYPYGYDRRYYRYPYNSGYPSFGFPYFHSNYSSAIIGSQVSNVNQSLFNLGVATGVSQTVNSMNIGNLGGFGGLGGGW